MTHPPVSRSQPAPTRPPGPVPLSREAEKLARHYHRAFTRKLPLHLDRDDLLTEALLAAWLAEKSFDPARGPTLRTWIRGCVWRALKEHLRTDDHLSRTLRQQQERDGWEACYLPPVWLDSPFPDGAEEGRSLAETVSGGAFTDAEGMTPALREAEGWRLLLLLKTDEARVCYRHFFRDENYLEIAARLGKSQSRIVQLQRASCAFLREVTER